MISSMRLPDYHKHGYISIVIIGIESIGMLTIVLYMTDIIAQMNKNVGLSVIIRIKYWVMWRHDPLWYILLFYNKWARRYAAKCDAGEGKSVVIFDRISSTRTNTIFRQNTFLIYWYSTIHFAIADAKKSQSQTKTKIFRSYQKSARIARVELMTNTDAKKKKQWRTRTLSLSYTPHATTFSIAYI